MKNGGRQRGPLGDYAVVFIRREIGQNAHEDGWWGHYACWWAGHASKQKGAIRVASCDNTKPHNTWHNEQSPSQTVSLRATTWTPRDSMSRIVDGTSNVFIVGEKHVRANEFGRCCGGSNADGSYHLTDGGWREYQVARNIRLRFGLGPNDDGRLAKGWPRAGYVGDAMWPHSRLRNGGGQRGDPARGIGFGSWHPGIIQFLRADGSVNSVANDISVSVRGRLGHCQDGEAIPQL